MVSAAGVLAFERARPLLCAGALFAGAVYGVGRIALLHTQRHDRASADKRRNAAQYRDPGRPRHGVSDVQFVRVIFIYQSESIQHWEGSTHSGARRLAACFLPVSYAPLLFPCGRNPLPRQAKKQVRKLSVLSIALDMCALGGNHTHSYQGISPT